ncbi:MAG: CNNM domain-containing protein [Nocardioides sp.]|nr:CNNM domain-containing protein [Nocardioides sp.]
MDGWMAIPVTVAIIATSAFFVAVEFAVIASRRTRLEAAATNSRSARAALRSSAEVSVLLAGCQLGITACTLALGAITKPALEHALQPLLGGLGLPSYVSYGLAFTLALLLATFLHLVVGEMAPKSWAISHPERSATLFALPMRGFMWVFRPVLVLLNESANGLVRRVGVEPVEEVAVEQGPDDLRQLVLHSAETGDLDEVSSAQLAGALKAARLPVGDIVTDREVVAVDEGATVAEVKAASRASGHLRIVVDSAYGPSHVVHVRDVLTVAGDEPVAPYQRELRQIAASTTVLDAMTSLRRAGTQIAVVRRPDGPPAVITVADLLSHLVPAAAEVEGATGR